jgi:hypothetical protein
MLRSMSMGDKELKKLEAEFLASFLKGIIVKVEKYCN